MTELQTKFIETFRLGSDKEKQKQFLKLMAQH